ncbi:N-acylglucosamine-6-phosphate 2-epimerase [Microbacterium ginsengiterrae]|uniref:N-acylglucosamine-6-phosphate 2-epimerase n=1 Tax=Microbacterium ginsengiterrae TaxID=546115 RepID=A0A7W9FB35_9MICO|nr:putative N-acetylmannosamine-6-phosphate 2-epimerase [Microbacterium ginsengiterrae]MBB5742886.1 N-acylglucosamine-6-phosphate 2-epimerase [Microbacterium ginsengiterrae]
MTHPLPAVLASLAGGLVVSVQANDGTPVRDVAVIAALAESALLGGARALRLNGPEDVRRVRAVTDVPIIGLHKVHNGTRNIITPEVGLAVSLAEAGADIIAVDATAEHLGTDFGLLGEIVAATGRPVMADVSTLDDGLRARDNGASIVGTTLSGYTPESRRGEEPDVQLIAELVGAGIPTIAEGRYRTPEQVAAAFDAGAFAVVVGGAITDPIAITRRFVDVTPGARE